MLVLANPAPGIDSQAEGNGKVIIDDGAKANRLHMSFMTTWRSPNSDTVKSHLFKCPRITVEEKVKNP